MRGALIATTIAITAVLGTAEALTLGVAPTAAAPDKPAAKRAHPLYDDGGTLDWRTKWAEAAELARERRSLVFVEWGRET